MTTHKDYETLSQLIWHHNKLYYVDHAPEISDEQFDMLLKKLEKMEQEHPEWVTPSSPTQRVNETPSPGFKTVTHRIPMLSLANCYSTEEIDDFLKRVRKLVHQRELAFSTELKMDGIAITARFEKGLFVTGATRGDGKEGDDITANLRTIQSLPLQLYGPHVPDVLEVRGEVFMPIAAFEVLNKEREEAEDVLFANPRNAAAGSLKLLDSRLTAQRQLEVVFYAVAEVSSHSLKTQHAGHAFMKSLGLPILPILGLCHTLEDILAFTEKVNKARHSLPFQIDGVVIKLDDLVEQQRLGTTGKSPRWAIAYKFAAEQATTRILDITVQVGRTGTLTPVAELEPVFLAGSTIARSTLHNEEEVARKDIRIGDWVVIEKGGDVIPKVVQVEASRRHASAKPWHMPTKCPSCGTPVERVPGEVAVRCPNARGCPEQQLRRLTYFAGKEGMDIENLGERIMEQLVTKGFVRRPSDLYGLDENQLFQLEGFKEKSVHNLLGAIDKSRNIPLDRFIMALGIKHVGNSTAELLAENMGCLEKLLSVTKDQLLEIDGIGDKVASAIVEYFADHAQREEIQRLLDRGVNPQTAVIRRMSGHPFEGKSFVLTGTLQKYTRTGAAALIKERGGKVISSLSAKTDYLVIGEDPGSKVDKAKKLGVRMLDEKEFLDSL